MASTFAANQVLAKGHVVPFFIGYREILRPYVSVRIVLLLVFLPSSLAVCRGLGVALRVSGCISRWYLWVPLQGATTWGVAMASSKQVCCEISVSPFCDLHMNLTSTLLLCGRLVTTTPKTFKIGLLKTKQLYFNISKQQKKKKTKKKPSRAYFHFCLPHISSP